MSSLVAQPSVPARGLSLERFLHAARQHGLLAGCVIWTVAFVVMIGLLLAGRLETIPYHVYAAAGGRWLSHQPLYDLSNIDGFQYFPQSALLMSPFAWLGTPLGDIAWRALGWSLYASGIWRMARWLAPQQAVEVFFVATCLAVVSATGSLGNGQANLLVAALTLHVAADLIARSWWRATFVLTVGFALKPLMVVLLLLVWALYRPMTWRVPLALTVIALAPWLLRPHAYVVRQYLDCWTKLGLCATPDRLFEDLRGFLASAGWLMPHAIYLYVRLGAAVVVFAICWRARTRVSEPYASLLIAALAVSYLMLFNPRTLSTSYAMTASCAGLLAGLYLLQERRRAAIVMCLIGLSWTVSYHLLPFVINWLRPFGCMVFVVMLVREIFGLTGNHWQRGSLHQP